MAAPKALSLGDPTSHSNPEEWASVDIVLNLAVNFKSETLSGFVEHELARKKPGSNLVIFDAKDLTIQRVYGKEDGKQLQYTLGEAIGAFGSKLQVTLPADAGAKTFTLVIDYETSPKASALQWLSAAQTAGRRHPYLFSQCQAIHARSMLPCQDTSAVKAPYRAVIRAPSELRVLMSGGCLGDPEPSTDSETSCFKTTSFHQPVPVPSYLIAIVVGDLVGKDVSERVTIYTEPEFLDRCAYEFADTEKMLSTAIDLCGEYVWGRYDLLVLPPSFPYGGMENPCLTFVTPTLLAGDRSLTSVVAHEISHSWTGNLVTNTNPDHFWLNEGHTVFLERKILGRMFGNALRDFYYEGGWDTLQVAVDGFGKDSKFTKLVQDHTGVDPDDSFSRVFYEKGSTFLFYLESQLGGPDVFEAFLRSYLVKFARKSITTSDWKAYLFEYFSDKADVLASIDFDAWMYGTGMPPLKPDYDQSLRLKCEELANWWVAYDAEKDNGKSVDASVYENLLPKQKEHFISNLHQHAPLPAAKIAVLKRVYGFGPSMNAEMKCRWLQLCLMSKYKEAISETLDFLTEQGRMKFSRPLYKELGKWEASRDLAIQTFTKNRPSMHPIAVHGVCADLGIPRC